MFWMVSAGIGRVSQPAVDGRTLQSSPPNQAALRSTMSASTNMAWDHPWNHRSMRADARLHGTGNETPQVAKGRAIPKNNPQKPRGTRVPGRR